MFTKNKSRIVFIIHFHGFDKKIVIKCVSTILEGRPSIETRLSDVSECASGVINKTYHDWKNRV